MSRRKSPGADIISNLPDDIIVNILSKLPLWDAVRTSILSREWRYKWMYNPVLVFGPEFNMHLLKNHRLEIIIYRMLLHKRGHISKFALQVPSYSSTSDLDHWILQLSKCRIEDFILELSCGRKHVLSSHFFGFQYLRHLTLYRCVFRPPAEFKAFSKLETLNLQDVDFDPAVVGPLIARCTVLEKLRVVNCTHWNSIVVEGPGLKSFTFHGAFQHIRFKHCPLLDKVILSTPTTVNQDIRGFSVGIKSFDFHPSLRELHLHPHMLEFLGAAPCLRRRHPLRLNNLKVLDITMFLDTVEEFICLYLLLRSSPNLEMLRIWFNGMTGTAKDIKEFIRVSSIHCRVQPDYLNQLKRVEISCFRPCIESQMEFARYILAYATGLVEMAILPKSESHCMGRMVNELQKFPKASPNARVVTRSSLPLNLWL